MKVFAIVDAEKRKARPCGWLSYDEEKDVFSIDLSPQAPSVAMPALLGLFVDKGELHLDDGWTRRWLEERMLPSGRQNLGQVLKAHGLQEYDIFLLLMSSMGECAQDSFVLRPVAEREPEGDGAARMKSRAAEEGADEWANDTQSRPLSQSVGRMIAEQRKRLGISQIELAKRTGVQQPVISRIERGQGNPTLELIEALAKGLGARVEMGLQPEE